MFTEDRPLEAGWVLEPRIGPVAAARHGAVVPGKVMHGEKRAAKSRPAVPMPKAATVKRPVVPRASATGP
eukprot:8640495-Pyramimonas_sp.AAC.1